MKKKKTNPKKSKIKTLPFPKMEKGTICEKLTISIAITTNYAIHLGGVFCVIGSLQNQQKI